MRGKALVLAIFCLFVMAGPAYLAFAEEEEEITSDAALEISPVTKRIKLNSGEKHDDKITIKNNSEEPLKVRIYATPYSDNENSEARDFETENSYTQLSKWITVKSADGEYQGSVQYSLAANETKTVSYRIKVPETSVGGQYAVLFVETIPEEDESTPMKTSSRVGMTIYLWINGDIIRSAEIKDVYAGTSTDRKIGIHATVVNAGNIDFQVSISMTVSSIFGHTLYNDSRVQTIFPETTREVNSLWGGTPFFGLYRVNYTFKALDKNETREQLVLIAPIPLIIVLAILFVVTIAFVVAYRREKRQFIG